MEIKTVDKAHVLTYQVVVAVVAALVVFAAGHFGGHYLHESQARTIQNGDRAKGAEGDHLAAKQLADGFKDTQAFDAMKLNLVGNEAAGATTTEHPVEKYAPFAALAALVIGFFASQEAGRVYARKKLAQGSIARATQKFQKPTR